MINTFEVNIGGHVVATSLKFTYDIEKGCYKEASLNREFSVKQVMGLVENIRALNLKNRMPPLCIKVQDIEYPMWVNII